MRESPPGATPKVAAAAVGLAALGMAVTAWGNRADLAPLESWLGPGLTVAGAGLWLWARRRRRPGP